MTTGLTVRIWTMRVDRIDESAAERWRSVLDAMEQERASRFVFSRHRVVYIAAHALMRTVLSQVLPGEHPASWHLVEGEHGKPVAWLGNRPAPLSFNLSHTDGIVGLATVASPGHAVGFDLEKLDRKVTLDVASRYFRQEEVAWLNGLPPADQPRGFLRLWTLKEAFIKATGEGLARDLASFWFTPGPPRVHFTAVPGERSEDWQFEQRVIDGQFVAATGLRRPADTQVEFEWSEVNPVGFRPADA